jgi:hypothetical protein
MAYPGMVIQRSGPPERCDICHRADQFDPVSEHCRRCAGLVLPPLPGAAITTVAKLPWQDRFSRWLLYSFCAMFLLSGATVISAAVGAYPLVIMSGVFALFFGAAFVLLTLFLPVI